MTLAPATTSDRCISDWTYPTSGSPGVGPLLPGDTSPFTLTIAGAQPVQHLLNTVPSGLTRTLAQPTTPAPLPRSSSPAPALQSLHPKLCSAPRAPQLGQPQGKSCPLLPCLDAGPSPQWRSSWSAALSLSLCRAQADTEAWPGSLLPRPLPLASVQEAPPRSSSPEASRPRRAGAWGAVLGLREDGTKASGAGRGGRLRSRLWERLLRASSDWESPGSPRAGPAEGALW